MTEQESISPIVPTITDLNRPFWDGCLEGVLRLQACLPDGHLRYPIADSCPTCLSRDFEWRDLSGDGEILSAVVFHRAYNKAFAPNVPYNVVLVQLDEGPRMFSNVLPLSSPALPAGTRVHVQFDPIADGVAIPRFVPTAD
jgi:uncharacterized OB-fold protein